MTYGTLLDRVTILSAALGAEEHALATRVIAICRALDARERVDGRLSPEEADMSLRRELGRLTEQLGRRATRALPAATLGRAALADLHADERALRALLTDCEAKLALLGH